MPLPKRSPGPWSLGEANTSIPIKDAKGRTIASVRFRENDLADARTLAAAPKLLDALTRAEAFISSLPIDRIGSTGIPLLLRDLREAAHSAEA